MTAAIYIRKSRKSRKSSGDEEAEEKPAYRLTVQREQLPAYAKSQGWQYEIYDDGHASAARGKVEDLRERARLEADVRAGKINIILTIELSRLSRDDSGQDFMAWMALCRDYNVKLATLTQIINPRETNQWVLSGITGLLSAAEMQKTATRMKEGRDEAFAAGKFLGGQLPPPYIYDKNKGRPVIDPEQLTRMQTIWGKAEKKSARAVALELGIAPISVRRSLADDRLLFYQAIRLNPQTGEQIQCDWEPCMDAEQESRIKAARRDRKKGYKRPIAGGLLSNLGLLTCGYCGRSIRAWNYFPVRQNGKQEHYAYYGCKGQEISGACEKSRRVHQSIINERTVTNLISTLSSIDDLRTYWQASRQADPTGTQLADLEKRLNALQAKKKRIAAAVIAEALDFAEAKAARLEIEAQMKEIARQHAAIKAQRDIEPEWDSLTITREEFDALTQEEQRELIPLAIKQIRFYSTYLIIEYRFPRADSGDATARIHLPPARSKPTRNRTLDHEL